MYINRSLEKRVEYMADHFPVILVSGARQAARNFLKDSCFRSNHAPGAEILFFV